jgi:tungstate transport system substrate-binding protein
MRIDKRLLASLIFVLLLIPITCKQKTEKAEETVNKDVILATTTSVNDTGVLDVLIEKFREASGFNIKPIAVGSGEAMAMGKRGDADVLVVHSPKDEEAFMKEGFGIERYLVMTNTFMVVGPAEDPAGCFGAQSAAEAFKKIAETKSNFVTRGDNSGTHKKELAIWNKTAITPTGEWYITANTGMGAVLQIANEKRGYTLSDCGTYLAFKSKLSLKVMVEKDPLLLNPYSVIVLNPDKFPKINVAGAKAFAKFLLLPETKKLIGDFGKDKYGEPLFYPAER